MKKNFLVVMSCFIVFFFPSLILADCIPIGQYNSFSVEDGQTVTLYLGGLPVVRFDVNCTVGPTSSIRLLKASVCDGDDIEIDGSRCWILTANLP